MINYLVSLCISPIVFYKHLCVFEVCMFEVVLSKFIAIKSIGFPSISFLNFIICVCVYEEIHRYVLCMFVYTHMWISCTLGFSDCDPPNMWLYPCISCKLVIGSEVFSRFKFAGFFCFSVCGFSKILQKQ